MAIIYTYPVKAIPANDDLILISDSADSNKTKQVKVSSLPGGSSSGVTQIIAGNNVTIDPVNGLGAVTVNASGGGSTSPGGSNTQVQFNNSGAFGGSADLTFATNTLAVKHTVDIKGQGQNLPAGKLKLNCEMNTHAVTIEGPIHNNSGTNYTLKLPSLAPQNNQILQFTSAGNLGWINTPTGGGSVSITADNSSTDYVDIQVTPSPITGTGTIMADLNAVDGTSDTTTRFLSKDNTWDVPSYTTDTTYDVMGSGNSYAAGLVLAGNATHSDEFLRKDGTWQTVPSGTNTNIGGNDLILTNNRTLNFYSDTSDKSLTFISTISGTKTLFKFSTVANKPKFTIGDTASAYEGTLDITGNGSNRTGKINLYNAAGTYSYNIQAPTTFGATSNIPLILPDTQGGANTFLQNNGSGTLTWAVPATNITLTTTGTSGAATWNGTTLNIPQYTGGSGGGSLGFAPLEIYAANTNSTASYIYYMVAVCDVDFTVNKCKVAVTSGTDPVYVAVYSMTTGNIQSATLSKLGALQKTSSVATGVNELSLAESAFSLTVGQTICIGISTACQLASGSGINNTALGLMATSGGGSALPNSPDFEGLGSANIRPAIHFYAS